MTLGNYTLQVSTEITTLLTYIGPGSLVRLATEVRAGRSWIEAQWGQDYPPFQTSPVAHPSSWKMGTGSFPGVKCGRHVLLNTHPFYCRGHGKVELYLYPPSGPHRACNGLILPFFTQSRSSCTLKMVARSLPNTPVTSPTHTTLHAGRTDSSATPQLEPCIVCLPNNRATHTVTQTEQSNVTLPAYGL